MGGRRVLVAGATGTIGRAVVAALAASGERPVAIVRPGRAAAAPPGAEALEVDLSAPVSPDALGQADGVISCLASRGGAPADAWAVEHRAQLHLLAATEGAGRFVLLSAICVQKPKLEFQRAKLAFEAALRDSGRSFVIVRPTAFFKSLSGQAERVRSGKPFLLFGDGTLTACKPISDRDCAVYLLRCLDDPAAEGRILPIGGPGPALNPKEQGTALFQAFGAAPKFKHVPVGLMDAIAGGLALGGWVSGRLADKAEFARIGRYYATESMLVWDAARNRYDADATPETGVDRLEDFYARLARGEAEADLGAHSVF